ncbi:MAG: hypothetical protein ABJP48_03670 [Erythrobacter sp.]
MMTLVCNTAMKCSCELKGVFTGLVPEQRAPEERLFRVEFDLTKEVTQPVVPRGWE